MKVNVMIIMIFNKKGETKIDLLNYMFLKKIILKRYVDLNLNMIIDMEQRGQRV